MHSAGWQLRQGESPVVAVALHDGHVVRDDVDRYLAVGERDRLPHEDPFTRRWTSVAPTRVVALHSRFEVDFDRPRDAAVSADGRLGRDLWNTEPPEAVVARSLALYDGFYERMEQLFAELVERFGGFCLLDIHSSGDDGDKGPAVDVCGVGADRWRPVVDGVVDDLRRHPLGLDVTDGASGCEGWFPRWVEERFGDTGCCVSVDFAQTYLDGSRADEEHLDDLVDALAATVPRIERVLAPG